MKKRPLNKVLLVCMGLYLVLGLVPLILTEKGEIVVWFNENHSSTWDFLFRYWTYLGDASTYVILFFILLFVRYYYAFLSVVTGFFTLLLSQGLKRTIFNGWSRPIQYFEENIQWNFIDGVDVAVLNTFPSGHTITAFSLLILISCMINKKIIYICAFILAAGVAVSRVYLLQHFYIDVYFGGLLGYAAVVLGVVLGDYLLGERLIAKLKTRSITKNSA